MKLKEVLYWLGIKPKPVEYGLEIAEHEVEGYGRLRYAHWLHPKARRFRFSSRRIDVLRKILSPGDTAIDVGAHAGDTTVEMALAVGGRGTVFAFEPNRYVFKALERNAALNPGQCHIVPFNFAATETDAELTFNYSDPGFCNGGEFLGLENRRHAHFFTLPVVGKNIASLLAKEHPEEMARLRYVKIDAEGADYRILKTLEPLVKSARPHIRTEINRHMPAHERLEYWRYLVSLGYSVVLADEDDGPGGAALSEGNIDAGRTFDVWAVPGR